MSSCRVHKTGSEPGLRNQLDMYDVTSVFSPLTNKLTLAVDGGLFWQRFDKDTG